MKSVFLHGDSLYEGNYLWRRWALQCLFEKSKALAGYELGSSRSKLSLVTSTVYALRHAAVGSNTEAHWAPFVLVIAVRRWICHLGQKWTAKQIDEVNPWRPDMDDTENHYLFIIFICLSDRESWFHVCTIGTKYKRPQCHLYKIMLRCFSVICLSDGPCFLASLVLSSQTKCLTDRTNSQHSV